MMNLNQLRVADYLISHKAFPDSEGIHRSTICADLELAWSTAYDALVFLENQGIVERFKKRKTGSKRSRGRPKTFYRLTTEEF